MDIVFNFHKVYGILDEIIVGGEVLETAKDVIVNSIKNLEVEDWSIINMPWVYMGLYAITNIWLSVSRLSMHYHISTDAEVAREYPWVLEGYKKYRFCMKIPEAKKNSPPRV